MTPPTPTDLDAGPRLPGLIEWHTFWGQQRHGVDWLVPGLLPSGAAVSLTADPKDGKSLLALYIAYSLSEGREPFTGKKIDPVTVLYLDAEMHQSVLAARLGSLGCEECRLPNLAYASFPGLVLDREEDGRRLTEFAVRNLGAKLVIIDTLASHLIGPEDRAETIGAFHRNTGAPLKSNGVAVLRLDHTGHRDKGRARGSSAKAGDVDAAWTMKARRRKGSSLLAGAELRPSHTRLPGFAEGLSLRFEDQHAQQWILSENVRVDPLTEPVGRRVLAALAAAPEGLTAREMAASVVGDNNRIVEARRCAEARGLVRQASGGRWLLTADGHVFQAAEQQGNRDGL